MMNQMAADESSINRFQRQTDSFLLGSRHNECIPLSPQRVQYGGAEIAAVCDVTGLVMTVPDPGARQ